MNQKVFGRDAGQTRGAHAEDGNNSLAKVVGHLLTYQNLFRIYHWQTTSYARHKASDELLSSLGDLVDRLVEGLQGANRQRVLFSRPIQCKFDNVDDRYATQLVLNFKQSLQELHTNIDVDPGISNTIDEMIALMDKTLYLFTFE